MYGLPAIGADRVCTNANSNDVLLECPYCKHDPLELETIDVNEPTRNYADSPVSTPRVGNPIHISNLFFSMFASFLSLFPSSIYRILLFNYQRHSSPRLYWLEFFSVHKVMWS